MTDKDMKYLKELYWLMHKIKDDYQREVFNCVCMGFQAFKMGRLQSKFVTKETILKHLIGKGFVQRKPDGTLPDDRKVRETARELLKQGYPIMATAKEKGFFIAETIAEIDEPQKQNYDRAVAILAVDKGYNKVRELLSGQMRIFS